MYRMGTYDITITGVGLASNSDATITIFNVVVPPNTYTSTSTRITVTVDLAQQPAQNNVLVTVDSPVYGKHVVTTSGMLLKCTRYNTGGSFRCMFLTISS